MDIGGIALVTDGVLGDDAAGEAKRRTDRQVSDEYAVSIQQPKKGRRSPITGLYIPEKGAKGLHRCTKGKEQAVQATRIAQLVEIVTCEFAMQ